MKTLEIIFFKACIYNCMYLSYNGSEEYEKPLFTIKDIIRFFVLMGFSWKQLDYYLKKWCDIGFYDYGVDLELGWFEFEKLKGEYEVIYKESKGNAMYLSKKGFTELSNEIISAIDMAKDQ